MSSDSDCESANDMPDSPNPDEGPLLDWDFIINNKNVENAVHGSRPEEDPCEASTVCFSYYNDSLESGYHHQFPSEHDHGSRSDPDPDSGSNTSWNNM